MAFVAKYGAKKMMKNKMKTHLRNQVKGEVQRQFFIFDFEYHPKYEDHVTDRGKIKRRRREPPPHYPEKVQKTLRRVENVAYMSDMCIDKCGIRVGYSALIGLIPGVGDVIKAVAALVLIVIPCVHRTKGFWASTWLLIRQLMLVLSGFIIGLVPLAGDFIDALYKENSMAVQRFSEQCKKSYPAPEDFIERECLRLWEVDMVREGCKLRRDENGITTLIVKDAVGKTDCYQYASHVRIPEHFSGAESSQTTLHGNPGMVGYQPPPNPTFAPGHPLYHQNQHYPQNQQNYQKQQIMSQNMPQNMPPHLQQQYMHQANNEKRPQSRHAQAVPFQPGPGMGPAGFGQNGQQAPNMGGPPPKKKKGGLFGWLGSSKQRERDLEAAQGGPARPMNENQMQHPQFMHQQQRRLSYGPNNGPNGPPNGMATMAPNGPQNGTQAPPQNRNSWSQRNHQQLSQQQQYYLAQQNQQLSRQNSTRSGPPPSQ